MYRVSTICWKVVIKCPTVQRLYRQKRKLERGQIAIAALDAFRKAHKAGDEASAAAARKTLDENVAYFGYGYIKDPAHLVPNVGLTSGHSGSWWGWEVISSCSLL